MKPSIAILIPVLNRPHNVGPLIDSFKKHTRIEDGTLYFIAQEDDAAELAEIRKCMTTGIALVIVPARARSWPKKINAGFLVTSEPWMLLGGDDMRFHDDWYESLQPYLMMDKGVIGTPISGRPDNDVSSAHPIVSREYIKEFGTIDEKGKVVHEGYDHNFVDIELALTGWVRGHYQFAKSCAFTHLHPLHNNAVKIDSTYRLGSLNYNQDEALFNERSKKYGLQAPWKAPAQVVECFE
jgi:hypothetical protein